MKFEHTITSAWKALTTNTSRSVLTMLGIIIGIGSVIIVLSVGQSAQNLILDQVRSIGSNLVVIFPGESEENGPPVSVLGITVTSLKQKDIEAMRDANRIPLITAATGYVRGTATTQYQNTSRDATFLGVSEEYIVVEDAQVTQGRFFTQEEVQGLARVVVLGADLKDELFPFVDNPVGLRIKIGKQLFTVIGVLERRGSSGFQNTDGYAFVPLDTAQKILLGIDYLTFARIKISDESRMDEAIVQIREVLREEHDLRDTQVDDFTIRTTAQALGVLTTITDAIKFFLSAVAAISLLVGGVGIMNIMFVAITERTQEIGLRKAIGARQNDIIGQFVVEAMMISGVGGVIGIVSGIALSFIIALIVGTLGYQWDFVVTVDSIVLSVSFSVVIGLIFGLYPAYQASQLDPMEALRYE